MKKDKGMVALGLPALGEAIRRVVEATERAGDGENVPLGSVGSGPHGISLQGIFRDGVWTLQLTWPQVAALARNVGVEFGIDRSEFGRIAKKAIPR